ncbi:hypothetical protein D3C71_1971160 [compost metagenome]
MGALARHGAGEGLVDGDADAAHLAAVLAVELHQVAGLVGDGRAHGHADLIGLLACAFDQDGGFCVGNALDVQHGRFRFVRFNGGLMQRRLKPGDPRG